MAFASPKANQQSSAAYTPRPLPPASHWVDRLPPGKGKSLVVTRCQFCHDLERVDAFPRSKAEWKDVVETMIERGAPIAPQELPTIVDYLASSLGPAATHPFNPACSDPASPPLSPGTPMPIRGKYSIWVADQEDTTVDVIDPAVNQVVHRIPCMAGPEAIIFSPDGHKAYITEREGHTLDVVDTQTGAILHQVPVEPLGDRPNWAVISNDGKKVFVGIWPLLPTERKLGYIDVIDTKTLKVVKVIPTKGGIHDLWVTPNGKYFIAGSVMGEFLNVYDTATEKLAWSIQFHDPVTTMVISAYPGGRTRRIFLGHEIPGFGVIDFASRKEVQRVHFPGDYSISPGSAHGFGIAPDQKSLWLAGMNYGAPSYMNVYQYSLPALKLLGIVHMSHLDQTGRPTGKTQDGHWLCFSPDGSKVYVANHSINTVSVLSVKEMKEIERIPVGEGPLVIATLVRH